MSFGALSSYIKKIHEVRYFMPPFAGTDAEADALAAYIVGGLHGKEVVVQESGGSNGGETLFENNCSACHAVEDLSPSFDGVTIEGIRETLATLDQISDEMEPFEGSDDETELLAAFLYSLNNELPGVESDSPDGSVLFENNCSVCHAEDDMADYVSDWERPVIREALDKLETFSDEMVPYEGSPAEKDALADFINSLKGE